MSLFPAIFGGERTQPLSRFDLLAMAILLLSACLPFINGLEGGFVYDDERQVVHNPLIQQPSLVVQALTSDVWAFKRDGNATASNYWHPTFTALNILNFRLFGLNPVLGTPVNLILHALVCVSV